MSRRVPRGGILATLRDRPRLGALVVATVTSILTWPPLFVWLRRRGHGGPGGFRYLDFGVYYRAARDVGLSLSSFTAEHPEVLYDVDDPFGGYLYPPVYVIGFLPFPRLFDSFADAGLVFAVVSVLALWLSLLWLVRALRPGFSRRAWAVLAPLSLAVLVSSQPVLYGLRQGQVSAILAALLTLAAVAMERGRDGDAGWSLLSGGLTAVGTTVKAFYTPAAAHLLADRVRLAGAAVTGAALATVSVAIFGLETHWEYLQVLAWGEGWGTDPGHPSWAWIPGYYRPLYALAGIEVPLVDVSLSLVVRLGLVAGVIALSLWVRGRGVDRAVFAVGLAAVPLVGPQVSTHDLALLAPAIVLLLAIEAERDGHLWLPVLAVLLLHWQAYATLVFVSLPGWVPLSDLLRWAGPVLQPGLYGNLLLVGLAADRSYAARPLRGAGGGWNGRWTELRR